MLESPSEGQVRRYFSSQDLIGSDSAVQTARGGRALTALKSSNQVRLGAYLALLAVTYYFAARLGLRFRFQYFLVGIIWPANALLLAALVLTPRRRWWLVLTATAFAHAAALGLVVPVWRLLWQIGGNAAFTTVTAEALGRIAGPLLHLGSRRQVVAYVVTSFLSPL